MNRNLLGDSALIGAAVALLVVFGYMRVTGRFIAIEPNPWYFWSEIILFIGMLALGIERVVAHLRGGERR